MTSVKNNETLMLDRLRKQRESFKVKQLDQKTLLNFFTPLNNNQEDLKLDFTVN